MIIDPNIKWSFGWVIAAIIGALSPYFVLFPPFVFGSTGAIIYIGSFPNKLNITTKTRLFLYIISSGLFAAAFSSGLISVLGWTYVETIIPVSAFLGIFTKVILSAVESVIPGIIKGVSSRYTKGGK